MHWQSIPFCSSIVNDLPEHSFHKMGMTFALRRVFELEMKKEFRLCFLEIALSYFHWGDCSCVNILVHFTQNTIEWLRQRDSKLEWMEDSFVFVLENSKFVLFCRVFGGVIKGISTVIRNTSVSEEASNVFSNFQQRHRWRLYQLKSMVSFWLIDNETFVIN